MRGSSSSKRNMKITEEMRRPIEELVSGVESLPLACTLTAARALGIDVSRRHCQHVHRASPVAGWAQCLVVILSRADRGSAVRVERRR